MIWRLFRLEALEEQLEFAFAGLEAFGDEPAKNEIHGCTCER